MTQVECTKTDAVAESVRAQGFPCGRSVGQEFRISVESNKRLTKFILVCDLAWCVPLIGCGEHG